MQEYELREAQAEIARHHADFQRIQAIVDEALRSGYIDSVNYYIEQLKRIRNIVG